LCVGYITIDAETVEIVSVIPVFYHRGIIGSNGYGSRQPNAVRGVFPTMGIAMAGGIVLSTSARKKLPVTG